MRNLLTTQNSKTSKGESKGYLTGILYLAPSTSVEGINTCKFASKGCKEACLYTAGRGKFSNVKNARISKTELFRDDRNYFMQSLKWSIEKVLRKAKREELTPVIRLNGTSDIEWHNILIDGKNIFDHFSDVQFYDYTKNHLRFKDNLPKNYHLTFSMSENKANNIHAINILGEKKANVAVVFKELPETYRGFKVVNGDLTDLRFLDEKNVIVGLLAKGDAKKDLSGFVK